MPPPVASFLLSSATEPEELLAQCRQVAPTALQIVDAVDPAAYALLRRELPALRLVQVVHVTGERTVAEALAVATLVDALLLDSGSPDAPVRLLGGTGKVHDWAISRRIVEDSPVPVFLAGGLTPANVAEAIRARPAVRRRPVHRPAHRGRARRGASSRPSCRRWPPPEACDLRLGDAAPQDREQPLDLLFACCSSAARPERAWAGARAVASSSVLDGLRRADVDAGSARSAP